MGIRFRKSIKLAPGVRMNLSGGGVSWTLGPRGASVGIGKRGTYLNMGIPGTGLYTRDRIDSSSAQRISRQFANQHISVNVGITDEGLVYFTDANGDPLPEELVAVAKKQQGDTIRVLIQNKCDEINSEIEGLGEIHLHTPNPGIIPKYSPFEFTTPPPTEPVLKQPGLISGLFKSKREAIDLQNQEALRQYREDLDKWHITKQQFEEGEKQRKKQIEQDIYIDVGAMERYLEQNLLTIMWPRETNVSTEICDSGRRVYVDVDLPELEDMPSKLASVPQRGNKLTVKEMSPTQRQRLYMCHVHGVGFRIIGEIFTALPLTHEVVLSAYSQRPDHTTGRISDEFLYSVKVPRQEWAQIDFNNLDLVDVVDALTRFDLRRNMSKTGVFKPIEPFSMNEQASTEN